MDDLNSLKRKRDELNWKIERLSNIIERDQDKISNIDTLKQQLKIYEEEMNHTMNNRNLIHDLIEDQYQLSLLEDRIYESNNRLSELNEKYIKALEDYNELKDHQLKVYAGLLAHSLKEGEVCPVCGSIHHPSLAPMLDAHMNEEKIDEITAIYTRLSDQRVEETLNSENLQSNYDLLKKRILNYKNLLGIEEELSKELLTSMLYNIDKQTQKKLKEFKTNENELKYLMKLSKSVKDSLNLKDDYLLELETLNKKIDNID